MPKLATTSALTTPFDRPVSFSQRLRTHLQAILDELAGDMEEVIWDIEKQGSPFLGPNSILGLLNFLSEKSLLPELLDQVPPSKISFEKARALIHGAHRTMFLDQEDTGIFLGSEERVIVAGPRIGISRSRELPWRFGAVGSAALSARF